MVRKLRGWRVMRAVYYFFVLRVILLFCMGGAKDVLYVYMCQEAKAWDGQETKHSLCQTYCCLGSCTKSGNVMLYTYESLKLVHGTGQVSGRLWIYMDALAASHST